MIMLFKWHTLIIPNVNPTATTKKLYVCIFSYSHVSKPMGGHEQQQQKPILFSTFSQAKIVFRC